MEPSAPSLNRLLERLDSDWHLTRQAAMLQAASLPLEQMEQLLLMAKTRQKRKLRRFWKYITPIIAIIVIILMLSSQNGAQAGGSIAMLFLLMPVLLAVTLSSQTQHAYTAMHDICTATRDPRFTGTALTRLHRLKQSTTPRVEPRLQMATTSEALIAMLKNISAENAPTLTSEQHVFLLTLLCQDVELTRAAIYALPYIGRESALPFVVKVRENHYMPSDLRLDADACCMHLQQRLAEERQAQSLLRASSVANVAAPDVLLRPTDAQTAAAPPEQLLRAAVGEE